MIAILTSDSPQQDSNQDERPSRGRLRRVALIPPTQVLDSEVLDSEFPDSEIPNSLSNSVPLIAVRLRESGRQQIVLSPEKQVQLEQRQAVTNIAGGATIVGIGSILSVVLRYFGNVAMTHILSQSAFGIFVEVFTAVSIIGLLANLGLNGSLLRFLPTYRMKSEHSLAAGLLHFALWVALISGILCGAVFFLSSTALAHFVYHNDAYALPLKEAALLIPLIALQATFTAALLALKAVKSTVSVDRLIQPGLTLILMGVFYLLGLRLGGVILASLCGFLASVIMGQFLLGKARRQLVSDTVSKFAPKVWLLFALPLGLNSVIQNVSGNVDILSLALFAAPAQAGLYAAADRTSVFILMPFTIIGTIFIPIIVEYHAHDEHEQLAKMLKVVTKWCLSLSLPMFLCFCVFHSAILGVFSSEYKAASIVLIINSFGNLAFVVAGFTLNLLLMTGRAFINLANTVATIAINIALAFLLVPHFGALGAAVAASTSLIVLGVTGLIEVYWIMKVHPFRWDMLKPIGAGGFAAGMSFLLLHAVPLPDGRVGTLESLGLIIPFVLIYVLVLSLLGFSEEDTMVFDAIRTKLGSFARHKG